MLTSREAGYITYTKPENSPGYGIGYSHGAEKLSWDTLSAIPTLIEDSTESYLYGAGSTPFAQINKTTGTIEYLHGDERGSIIAASTSTGAYSWFKTFDEYGYESTLTPQSGVPQVTTRFAYAGEYQDPDTGLYNLRARWFEPETGSFLNIDPALGSTGEAYSYASANPLSNTDPLGLWSYSDISGWFNPLSDAVAGFGDSTTFGLTKWIRGLWNGAFNFTDGVNYCSAWYSYGETASLIIGSATIGANVLKAGARAFVREAKATWTAIKQVKSIAPESGSIVAGTGKSNAKSILAQNYTRGKEYERIVQKEMFPTGTTSPQTYFRPPGFKTGRYVDINDIANSGTIVEVKNTKTITLGRYGRQLKKDIAIVRDPNNKVTQAVWVHHPSTIVHPKFSDLADRNGVIIIPGPLT